ncbi:M48 family metallopeptidase [Reichenbachiella versicolor]|uniref:M48 family metallopeptidase n=1 Tax=Reichenbachiella versicolor TaxID=1821036 RepID=UPI000D6E0404|nr:M48 family metallopeptidase [Reichenbachiella versicolor]
MSEQTILYILIGITVFDFLLGKTLGILNNRSSKQSIPSELEGIYDDEKYARSQQYQSEVFNFSIFSSALSFTVTLVLLWTGVFGWLDGQVRELVPMESVATLAFFGILFIASDLIGIPFDLYGTFVIEEKYGFNKMTVKTYVMDKLKGYLLTTIIGGALMSVFLLLIDSFGHNFWIYFWIVVAVFLVVMNMFYTSLIMPLFNKLTPMEDSELKDAITEYSQKVGFPLNNIFVIDGSKRSSKGNAFFSGLGKKKKVVLYDTLIDNHTTEELVGVMAHEVGHFKKKHIIYSMILSVLQIGFMLWLLSKVIFTPEVSMALGGQTQSIALNIMAFGILYSPVSMLTGILMNIFSRKNEYEADEYAVRTYKKEPLITALKKLTSDNLGNLTPHPWYVFVNYSHPSLLQRIQAMNTIP